MEAAATLATASGGGALQFEGPAWNGCTVDMIRLAKAHAYLILQANFVSHIQSLKRKVWAQTMQNASQGRELSLC